MLPGSIAGGIREKKRPAGTRLAHLGPVYVLDESVLGSLVSRLPVSHVHTAGWG